MSKCEKVLWLFPWWRRHHWHYHDERRWVKGVKCSKEATGYTKRFDYRNWKECCRCGTKASAPPPGTLSKSCGGI